MAAESKIIDILKRHARLYCVAGGLSVLSSLCAAVAPFILLESHPGEFAPIKVGAALLLLLALVFAQVSAWNRRRVKCPECGASLLALFLHKGRCWPRGAGMTHCPECGLDLDAPLQEAVQPLL